MADTLTTVITAFRTDYYENCSAAKALILANIVHAELLNSEDFREVAIDVSLTDGTREYAPSGITSIMRVTRAYFRESATSDKELIPMTVQTMDDDFPGWRVDTDEGDPIYFYWTNPSSGDASSPKIGFHPIPDTTTSGGYPKVTLYTRQATSLDTSDEIPSQLMFGSLVYLRGMAALWAERRDREMYDAYKKLYDETKGKEIAHLQNLVGVTPSILPNWLGRR